MAAPSYHRHQLAANFQVELNRLLTRELEWEENVLVTVTGVQASVDGQHITVSVSVLPILQQQAVLHKLKRQTKSLSFQLGKLLDMRRTPELRFELEEVLM